MDVLILALNSKYIHSALAPWYLKSAVSEVTDGCFVMEHTVNEDLEVVLSDILQYSPKVIAISVYIWNVKYTYRLLERIKRTAPHIKVILGGPEVSYNPAEVLSTCVDADYVISGEGELPFSALCAFLLSNDKMPKRGVSYRKDQKIHLSQPYIGSGTPKSPYTVEYFAALNSRIAYFESSRGCPYSCAYCLSGRKEGLRFFDMDYVKSNLVLLAASGTKTIKFVDRTFNANRRRAIEIWSFILAERGKSFPEDVCFHFELSGDLLDDETIQLLSRAPKGLFQFEIGIQSFYPKTIKAIHRVTESEKLKNWIKALVNMKNAHIHTDLIAGLPYEGYEDFKNSFDTAFSLGADMLQLGFLKILHGTELAECASKYELHFSSQPPYEVYETPWLSRDDIANLKLVEFAVERLHNSGRFRRTLKFCVPKFERPFDFFFAVGKELNDVRGLDDLTDRFYKFLCNIFPQDKEEFREALVCDRFATNSSKVLPKSLYRADPYIAQVRKFLNASPDTAEKPHTRRSIAILYHSRMAVYTDYIQKNYRGEYPLVFLRMGDLQNEKT